MMPEEQAAAERLRETLQANRDNAPSHLLYRDADVGLLLCAVGRIDYMETHAERLAESDNHFTRRAARIILGWEQPG